MEPASVALPLTRHAGCFFHNPTAGPKALRKKNAILAALKLADLEVDYVVIPNIWDVAGGLALVRAAGRTVQAQEGGRWAPMERFEASARADGKADLRYWRLPVAIGPRPWRD